MSPTVLAGISAFCFAGSHVASKRGVESTSVVAGLLISLATMWVVLLGATILDLPGEIEGWAILVLAVSGLVAPAIGRAAAIAGVDRLGPSISVPIQAGVYPLVAVVGAATILDESITWTRFTGTVTIVLGILLLSRRTALADRSAEAPTDLLGPTGGRFGRTVSRAVVLPALAGLAYGTSDLIRKQGIDLLPYPTFAALVAVSAALLAWSAVSLALPSVRERISAGRGAGWFVVGGALAATAILVQFHALERGNVSLISPIVAAQPLFVFFLSTILLRRIERVTVPIVIGGLATVVGVVLVAT